MKHLHLADLHVAQRFTEAFERALHHDALQDPPARTVPAASDWPEWNWEDGGRNA